MTDRDGEWAAITFNGINGWVHTDYITELSDQVTPATSQTSFINRVVYCFG